MTNYDLELARKFHFIPVEIFQSNVDHVMRMPNKELKDPNRER